MTRDLQPRTATAALDDEPAWCRSEGTAAPQPCDRIGIARIGWVVGVEAETAQRTVEVGTVIPTAPTAGAVTEARSPKFHRTPPDAVQLDRRAIADSSAVNDVLDHAESLAVEGVA
ncbi:hypothetical protein [Pseudonocardia sp. ICBG1034]|uniref:hypothetical protein n=1 Tax=Pseudonocardia sp. ICBG1034 TaxID=2844381 RepID=UPI001CCBA978|nr:hypothetical protein [Pseudonocardia sp. ICBG1034]